MYALTTYQSFTITEGWKLWYVVRANIPSNCQPMVHQVDQALVCGLEGVERLLVGNLNARLEKPQD